MGAKLSLLILYILISATLCQHPVVMTGIRLLVALLVMATEEVTSDHVFEYQTVSRLDLSLVRHFEAYPDQEADKCHFDPELEYPATEDLEFQLRRAPGSSLHSPVLHLIEWSLHPWR